MADCKLSTRERSVLMVFAVSLSLSLLFKCSEASLYHKKGVCAHKEEIYKPGESFRRGCDKCFCHKLGFFCFTPMKPTSWPRKCRRVMSECGYTVVYKETPHRECRAYSWIG